MMKTTGKVLSVLIIGVTLIFSAGCAGTAKKTGFLKDYSRLEPFDDGLRYVNMSQLASYSKFIIDPVVVRMYGTPQGSRPKPETQIELANYMHNKVVKTIQDRYMVVSQPGPGVARVRIAITDLEKSTPALNVLPQTKLTGLGLGGASMEGEVLDSMTGEQVGAVVQSQKGSRISMAGLKEWGDAKAVMDEWAERFLKRLDEAHGK